MGVLYGFTQDSPAGTLHIGVTAAAVAYIGFSPPDEKWLERYWPPAPPEPCRGGGNGRTQFAPTGASALADALRIQLDEYLSGERKVFDLPLAVSGTAHERRVYEALCGIPYGQTVSYGELARRVGSGPRAVGQANHRNPLCIVIPCHRVIGADGSLTGYGGGLERKKRLLEIEKLCKEARHGNRL